MAIRQAVKMLGIASICVYQAFNMKVNLLGEQTDEFNPMDYTVGIVSMIVLVGLLFITIRD